MYVRAVFLLYSSHFYFPPVLNSQEYLFALNGLLDKPQSQAGTEAAVSTPPLPGACLVYDSL